MKNLFLLLLFPVFLSAQEDVIEYNKGVAAHNKNDYETAINCYKKCLEINHENTKAKTNIGIVYYNKSLNQYNNKEYEQSLESLKSADSYNSEDAKVYYMKGCCHQELNRHKEAILNYSKAIEFSKEPAAYYAARSWAYNDLHDNINRLADMKKAVEHNPENAEYQYHCGKHKQEVSMDEYKTAIKNYNKAISLNPDYKEAYRERGAWYMTNEQFDKALPDLKKAKELGADVDHFIEAAKFELEMED